MSTIFVQLQLLIEGLSGNSNDYNYTITRPITFEAKLRVIALVQLHKILVNFI